MSISKLISYSAKILLSLKNIKNIHKCCYSARKSQHSADYCIDLVRKHDYESYLCTLMLPNQIRTSAFAIRAFNTELALIRDMVSTSHLGLMRIEFWRNAVESIDKGKPPPNHPVALELAKCTEEYNLSSLWLKRLVDTRETTLTDKPHRTLKELETYADHSVSPVYFLLLEVLSVKDLQVDHAAGHLGKGQGITNHLRGIAYNATKNRVIVPMDLLVKHNCSQEDIIRRKSDQKMCDLIFEIASAAHEHLETLNDLKEKIPEEARSVFLPSVCSHNHLIRLQKYNFNIFESKLQSRNNLLPLKLFLAYLNRNK